jgi:hypothetical protein
MIQYQERDIDLISDCVEQLNGAPMAKAIAEESLGAARAHLDSLNELLASL